MISGGVGIYAKGAHGYTPEYRRTRVDHARGLAQAIMKLTIDSSHCKDPQEPTSMSIPGDPAVAAAVHGDATED